MINEQAFEKEWARYFEHRGDVATINLKHLCKHFIKWGQEQMMKDAIEVSVEIDAGGYPYINRTIEMYDYDNDQPLAKKGDKVKVIILKDD